MNSKQDSAIALKVVTIVIFLNIIVTYYFTLSTTPVAGGFARFFLLMGSSVVCPVVGTIISLIILKYFNKLNRHTAKYLLLNLFLLLIFFIIALLNTIVGATSEMLYKYFGQPTMELKELSINSDATCNYKYIITNRSPLPIINARIWEGSFIYIKFADNKLYPNAVECYLTDEQYINIYPGNNLIEGKTSKYNNKKLGVPTSEGTKSTSLDSGYDISGYIGIDMYDQYHQLPIIYSREKQKELMKMIYSLR